MPFDFEQDGGYQQATAAAEDKHERALTAAQNQFDTTVQAAETTFAQAKSTIQQGYSQAIAAAQANFNTARNALRHPGIDLAISAQQLETRVGAQHLADVTTWGTGGQSSPSPDCLVPPEFQEENVSCPSLPASLWLTPWHEYQHDLAAAELARAIALNQGHVRSVTDLADADVTYVQSTAAADKAHSLALATAHTGHVHALAVALLERAEEVADAKRDREIAVAEATRHHDQQVAAANLTYQQLVNIDNRHAPYDTVRILIEREVTEANAQFDFLLTTYQIERDHDLRHLYEISQLPLEEMDAAIEAAEADKEAAYAAAHAALQSALAAAAEPEITDRAASELAYAHMLIDGYQQRTEAVADQTHLLNLAIADADDDLAAILQAAESTFAGKRAAANLAYSLQAALQANAHSRKYADADRARRVVAAPSAAAFDTTRDDAASAHRQAAVAARGKYEVALFQHHHDSLTDAVAMLLAGSNDDSPEARLVQYQQSVATADLTRARDIRDARNHYELRMTTAYAALTADTNGANVDYANRQAHAEHGYATSLAAATLTWVLASDAALEVRDRDVLIADAGKAEGTVNAETQYARDRSQAEHASTRAKAVAHASWATAYAGAQANWFVQLLRNGYPRWLEEFARGYLELQADEQWRTAEATADAAYFAQLGAGQVARAAALGAVETTHAAALSAVGTAYAWAVNQAETQYASNTADAANDRAGRLASANIGHTTDVGLASQNFTRDKGGHDVWLQGQLGQHDVTRASQVAAAEAAYHRAYAFAEAERLGAWYWGGGDLPADAQFQAANAWAYFWWLDGLRQYFVQFATGLAQADAGRANNQAVATAFYDDQRAGASHDFDVALAGLEATRSTSRTAAVQAYNQQVTTLENGRRTSLAAAHGTLLVSLAEDTAARAVDAATAEASYQTGVSLARQVAQVAGAPIRIQHFSQRWAIEAQYEADRDYGQYLADIADAWAARQANLDPVNAQYQASLEAAAAERTVARADTQLAHDTRVADAELTWTFTAAAANRQYIQGEATKAEQLAQALSTADRTYTRSAADETAERDNAFATQLVGLWNDQQSADNQWNTKVGEAQADFWTRQYAEQSSAMVSFVSSLAGLPWAQFRHDLAQAKQSWWQTVKPGYLQWIADVNAQHTAYTTAVGLAHVGKVSASTGYDVTYAYADASATKSRSDAHAAAERGFLNVMAQKTEDYLKAHEQAERDYRVAFAQATRNHATGQDASGGAYGPEEHSATLSAASEARDEGKSAANFAYRMAHAVRDGLRGIAAGSAELQFVVAGYGARLTWVTNTAVAERQFAELEADAQVAEDYGIAELDAEFWQYKATTYASTIADFAIATPSPWAQFEAAQAAADAAYVGVVAPAKRLREESNAESTREEKLQIATAVEEERIAQATVDRDQQLAAAAASLIHATARSVSNALRVVGGTYLPKMPLMPTPPLTPRGVDAVIEEDYSYTDFTRRQPRAFLYDEPPLGWWNYLTDNPQFNPSSMWSRLADDFSSRDRLRDDLLIDPADELLQNAPHDGDLAASRAALVFYGYAAQFSDLLHAGLSSVELTISIWRDFTNVDAGVERTYFGRTGSEQMTFVSTKDGQGNPPPATNGQTGSTAESDDVGFPVRTPPATIEYRIQPKVTYREGAVNARDPIEVTFWFHSQERRFFGHLTERSESIGVPIVIGVVKDTEWRTLPGDFFGPKKWQAKKYAPVILFEKWGGGTISSANLEAARKAFATYILHHKPPLQQWESLLRAFLIAHKSGDPLRVYFASQPKLYYGTPLAWIQSRTDGDARDPHAKVPGVKDGNPPTITIERDWRSRIVKDRDVILGPKLRELPHIIGLIEDSRPVPSLDGLKGDNLAPPNKPIHPRIDPAERRFRDAANQRPREPSARIAAAKTALELVEDLRNRVTVVRLVAKTYQGKHFFWLEAQHPDRPNEWHRLAYNTIKREIPQGGSNYVLFGAGYVLKVWTDIDNLPEIEVLPGFNIEQ